VESKYLSDIVVNEELVDFIKKNTNAYNFHILSNNMHSTIDNALKKMEMQKYFIDVLGRDSVPTPKPHPI
jgi:phosphoglycolate phosphatase-like HAD superfamily hydrolase